MRRIIVETTFPSRVTVNSKDFTALKQNLDRFIFELVEETPEEENIDSKIINFSQKKILRRFPGLSKDSPLVFERYLGLLSEHIKEKFEDCLMPIF